MPSFRASTSTLDAARRSLALSGEIDLANAERIVDLGKESLAHRGTQVLVIDLGNVTFMDSTALSALVQIRNAALPNGQLVTLANVPSRIQRLLEMTGLATVFGSDGSPAAG